MQGKPSRRHLDWWQKFGDDAQTEDWLDAHEIDWWFDPTHVYFQKRAEISGQKSAVRSQRSEAGRNFSGC